MIENGHNGIAFFLHFCALLCQNLSSCNSRICDIITFKLKQNQKKYDNILF